MRAPAQPSSAASDARREAEAAVQRATRHHALEATKVAEAEAVSERLVGHRRANSFTELFRQALSRNP